MLYNSYSKVVIESGVYYVEETPTAGSLIYADKENDIMGRVYEYFLTKFALQEGKGKGEFYTPKSVVNLIAEMIEPYKGKIYDLQ